MWAEDGGDTGVYAGCRALYVLVMRRGELLNFVKVLDAGQEVFVDEVCSAQDTLRQGYHLTQQAFEALLNYTRANLPQVKRFRLRVAKKNAAAQHIYRQKLGFATVPRNHWLANPGDGHEFLRATVERVQKYLRPAMQSSPPRARFPCAVYAGFEHVGAQVERGEQWEEASAPPREEEVAAPRAHETAPPREEEREAGIGGSEGGGVEAEDEQHMDEEEQEDEAATAQEPAMGGKKADPSYGSVNIEEVIALWMRKLWREEVVRPGAPSQSAGLKVSLDAADTRRASIGSKHWTTMILQFLTMGVTKDYWGMESVKHILHKAQSPYYMAKLRFWAGKDDALNVRSAGYSGSVGVAYGYIIQSYRVIVLYRLYFPTTIPSHTRTPIYRLPATVFGACHASLQAALPPARR